MPPCSPAPVPSSVDDEFVPSSVDGEDDEMRLDPDADADADEAAETHPVILGATNSELGASPLTSLPSSFLWTLSQEFRPAPPPPRRGPPRSGRPAN